MSTTQDQWSNPERMTEHRPLLDVEQLRFDKLTQARHNIVETGRVEHGIGEVIDMAAYTGIKPDDNPIAEPTPGNVTQLSQYAQRIARSSQEQIANSSQEQNYDFPKAS